MRILTLMLLLFGASLATRETARADITPPDQAACRDAKPGDPCTTEDLPGVCTKTTCSRVRPGPDGHVVTHTYDCVKCLPPPAKPEPAKPKPAKPKPAKPAPAKPAAATMDAEPGAPDAEPGHGRTPMIAGLGIGFLVLVGGVWFTRRRERPAP